MDHSFHSSPAWYLGVFVFIVSARVQAHSYLCFPPTFWWLIQSCAAFKNAIKTSSEKLLFCVPFYPKTFSMCCHANCLFPQRKSLIELFTGAQKKMKRGWWGCGGERMRRLKCFLTSVIMGNVGNIILLLIPVLYYSAFNRTDSSEDERRGCAAFELQIHL